MLIRLDNWFGSPGAKFSNLASRVTGGCKDSTICARLGEAKSNGNDSVIVRICSWAIDTFENGHCKKAYRLYLKRKNKNE